MMRSRLQRWLRGIAGFTISFVGAYVLTTAVLVARQMTVPMPSIIQICDNAGNIIYVDTTVFAAGIVSQAVTAAQAAIMPLVQSAIQTAIAGIPVTTLPPVLRDTLPAGTTGPATLLRVSAASPTQVLRFTGASFNMDPQQVATITVRSGAGPSCSAGTVTDLETAQVGAYTAGLSVQGEGAPGNNLCLVIAAAPSETSVSIHGGISYQRIGQ